MSLKVLKDERGGGTLQIMLGIAIGTILLIPFFLNFGLLHATRGLVQTGADAAALAAANWYADAFSVSQFEGSCPTQIDGSRDTTPLEDVFDEYYWGVYRSAKNSSAARSQADNYASRNGSSLESYERLFEDSIQISGWRFEFVKTRVRTDRDSPVFYSAIYDRSEQSVGAHAAARAYLEAGDVNSCLVRCGWVTVWKSYVIYIPGFGTFFVKYRVEEPVYTYRLSIQWSVALEAYE